VVSNYSSEIQGNNPNYIPEGKSYHLLMNNFHYQIAQHLVEQYGSAMHYCMFLVLAQSKGGKLGIEVAVYDSEIPSPVIQEDPLALSSGKRIYDLPVVDTRNGFKNFCER